MGGEVTWEGGHLEVRRNLGKRSNFGTGGGTWGGGRRGSWGGGVGGGELGGREERGGREGVTWRGEGRERGGGVTWGVTWGSPDKNDPKCNMVFDSDTSLKNAQKTAENLKIGQN